MKTENTVITGATGFLGKHLSNRIKAIFPDARIILTSGHGDKTNNVVKLDLKNFSEVSDFISTYTPSVIFHLGGFVDLSRNYSVAKQCIDDNLSGTTNLLEAVKEQGLDHFMYASTEEVYGTTILPYKETDMTVPPSPYAVTKLACEHMCRIYAQEHGIPTTVFRIGTMYGPNQPEHRYIVQTIRKAIANEPIPLNSGTKKRDYIYVEDVADALIRAYVSSDRSIYTIYNIGGGVSMSLQYLVERIIALSQSMSVLHIGEIPDRLSEVDEWLMDSTKAKQELNWEPSTDIETGLRKTIDFYKKQ